MVLWKVWREYRWYYSRPALWWKRISLFFRIIGREHWCGRCTIPEALMIVRGVWGKDNLA